MLLRILLRAALTLADHLTLQKHLGGKDFIVLGTTAAQKLVGNIHIAMLLQILLQARFVIGINAVTAHIIDFLLHHIEQLALGYSKALVQLTGSQN